MTEPQPYRAEPDGVLLFLRVTPKAGTDRIEGVEIRDDGSAVLRIRVRAIPDKGKANAAVIAVVAKALGIPKGAVALVAGDTARHKTLRLGGEPEALIARLGPFLTDGKGPENRPEHRSNRLLSPPRFGKRAANPRGGGLRARIPECGRPGAWPRGLH